MYVCARTCLLVFCVYVCVCLCVSAYSHRVGLAQSVACPVGLGRVIPKTIIKMVQTASLHRHSCVRVGVWNCLWGNALKRSPGIKRKSRVSYPGPGFLSSATWPMLPKKHYNGLNQTKPSLFVVCAAVGVTGGR